MQNESFVAATYVQLMFEYLKQRQIAPAAVLGREDLALLEIAQKGGSEGRIPRVTFSAMLIRLQQQLGDPIMALRMGQMITPAHLGVLGYLILACANLGEALIRMDRYGRLVHDAHEMQIRQVDDQIELSWDIPSVGLDEALFVELGSTGVVQFARNITGLNSPMTGVGFRHRAPTGLAAYVQFFGCPVQFEQKVTFLRFPLSYLSLPLRQPDAVLLDILEAQATQALNMLPKTDVFLQDVRRAVMRLCRQGVPTLEQVAEQFHMTPRTMQRRLADHGTRFQPLVDEVRLQLADQYLQDDRLPLTDIAELLGYSDQSAFTRAYRRWTGVTPHERRRQLGV